MLAVGRDLDVFGILRPPARTRSRLALRLEEREEMSSVLRRSVESSVDEQSSDQYHPTAASSAPESFEPPAAKARFEFRASAEP